VPVSANLDSLTSILDRQPDRRRLGRRILGVGIGLVMVTIICAVLSIWHLRTVAIQDAEATRSRSAPSWPNRQGGTCRSTT
jgi:hypothetical protein